MAQISLLLVACVLSSNLAVAKPLYFNRLKNFYSESDEVFSRRCQNCHSSTGLRLNPFGQDFIKLLGNFETREEFFEELGALDSDEDGFTNLEEILDGTHPGVVD